MPISSPRLPGPCGHKGRPEHGRSAPGLAKHPLLPHISRHHRRCANVPRQLHPLAFELLPRLAIDLDGGQRTSARLTKAQTNCFRRIAAWGLEFDRDFVVTARVEHARWPEVSARALDADRKDGV